MVDVVTVLLVALDRSLFRVRNECVFCMSKSKLELCTWINGTGQPLTPTVRLSVRLLDPMHVCDASIGGFLPTMDGRNIHGWQDPPMECNIGRLLAYLLIYRNRPPELRREPLLSAAGVRGRWAQKRDRHHPLLS